MENLKVLACFNTKTVIFILETGIMVKRLAKGSIIIKMVRNILGIGKRIWNMDKESILGQTVENM